MCVSVSLVYFTVTVCSATNFKKYYYCIQQKPPFSDM